jgi:hypothetical protein
MKFQKKMKAIKILIALTILGISVATFSLFIHRKEASRHIEELKFSSKFAYGKKISFVEYHGAKKVYSVSIDSFSIERATIGPFAIGPLNVAHLNNVSVDLYIDEIESSLDTKKSKDRGGDEGIFDFEIPISNIRKNLPSQAKRIKAIRLKNIFINLWNDEKRIFRISSDTALLDRKTGDLVFTGHASMDAGVNGNLISHRIRWNRKTWLFRVTDPYVLTKGKDRREGTGIETDFLFRRINDRPSNKQSL